MKDRGKLRLEVSFWLFGFKKIYIIRVESEAGPNSKWSRQEMAVVRTEHGTEKQPFKQSPRSNSACLCKTPAMPPPPTSSSEWAATPSTTLPLHRHVLLPVRIADEAYMTEQPGLLHNKTFLANDNKTFIPPPVANAIIETRTRRLHCWAYWQVISKST